MKWIRTLLALMLLGLMLVGIIAVIRSRPRIMGPLKNGAAIELPAISDIDEIRADAYNSLESFKDELSVIIPKDNYSEVLSFFQPSREAWFPEYREHGRVTIKTKGKDTTTVVFYQAADNQLCFTKGGVQYMHESDRSWEADKLDALVRRIGRNARDSKNN